MHLLRNHDFVRLLAGRFVTNAGDSLYFVAAMWLVFELTGDPAYTGLAGFLVFVPGVVQALLGPLVDRWPLRRVLVSTQLIQAVLVLVIPVAHAFGMLTVGVVLTVMPVLSLANQIATPAETAALPRVVEREDLVTANSYFAFAYQGVDALFNAAGGLVVALFGAVVVFLFDSVTFVVAALLFATLGLPAATRTNESAATGGHTTHLSEPVDEDGAWTTVPSDQSDTTADGGRASYLADLREGIDFYRHSAVLVSILSASVVLNGTFGVVIAALPAYGELLGGAASYGFLMAAIGTGTFVGSLLATRLRDYPFGTLSIVSSAAAGLVWIAAIAVSWTPATAVLLTVSLVPIGVVNVLIYSTMQSIVPARLLGRVLTAGGSVLSVALPLGSLLGGVAAATFGPTPVVAMGGVGFVVLAGFIALNARLRSMPAVADMRTLGG